MLHILLRPHLTPLGTLWMNLIPNWEYEALEGRNPNRFQLFLRLLLWLYISFYQEFQPLAALQSLCSTICEKFYATKCSIMKWNSTLKTLRQRTPIMRPWWPLWKISSRKLIQWTRCLPHCWMFSLLDQSFSVLWFSSVPCQMNVLVSFKFQLEIQQRQTM